MTLHSAAALDRDAVRRVVPEPIRSQYIDAGSTLLLSIDDGRSNGSLSFRAGKQTMQWQWHLVGKCVMPGLHLQRNRRNSAIQNIYDGRRNFNDGCVASGARLLRCSNLMTGPS